jgi:hypothetical protein
MPKQHPRRGLENLRTQSSKRGLANLSSPELYIKLTALEMERARRITERDSLAKRVIDLDRRIAEIDQEKETVNKLLPFQRVLPSTGNEHTMPNDSFPFTY